MIFRDGRDFSSLFCLFVYLLSFVCCVVVVLLGFYGGVGGGGGGGGYFVLYFSRPHSNENS